MNKKLIFTLTTIILIFLVFYLVFPSRNVDPNLKANIDYLKIDTSESIIHSISDTEKIEHNREAEVTPEIENLIYQVICEQSPKLCDENNPTVEMQLGAVDLNEDGKYEYISMPRTVSGIFLRGASGNGDIYVLENNADGKLEVIASLVGNSYIVLNSKLNGYFKILTHEHLSVASGVETIYAKEKDNFGVEDYIYVEQIIKWYRQY